MAALWGYKDIVQTLIKTDKTPEFLMAKDVWGLPAYILAERQGHKDISDLIRAQIP